MKLAVLSVSELNTHIKNLLEDSFYQCAVIGEISNLSRPNSGHIYFTLKDQSSQIRCVAWRNTAQKMGALLENGAQITVIGRLSVYEPRGEYQITVELVQDTGKGALYQAYEQLKAKLEAEGLFSQTLKKPIPKDISSIGIITSASAAALQDVLSTLKRRRPDILVEIYSSMVQGEEAPTQLIRALNYANHRQSADVILLIRGGGSIEDLWAYNNEALARCIAASKISIISGVGHETDFTIADFVADLRAPTPTAAAELSCDDATNLLKRIAHSQQYLQILIQNKLQKLQQKQQQLTQHLQRNRPDQKLAAQHGQVLFLQKSLQTNIQKTITHLQQQTNNLINTLQNYSSANLSRRLNTQWQNYYQLEERLLVCIQNKIQEYQTKLQNNLALLDALSPLKIMQRGYSISYLVENNERKLITNVHQIKPEQMLEIQVTNGSILAKIQTIKP